MTHSKPERTSAKLSAYQEGRKWNRTFSSVVCFLLDNFGYSDDMRKFRESAYEIMANNFSSAIGDPEMCIMATGSKGEGASMLLQGDHDYMMITGDILCVENNSRFSDFCVLNPERNDSVPPGYTRVVAVHTESPSLFGRLSTSVFYSTQDGRPYVSSAIFMNFKKKTQSLKLLPIDHMFNYEQVSHSGPAFSKKCSFSFNLAGIRYSSFVGDVDLVYGIYFYSSQYTSKLATRLNRRELFSPSLIDSICSTEGFIVPVGSTEGEDPDLEWRISYVITENKIIRNLNTTQFKLYVIMKMIAKELINLPVVSSYVVKNVVLWICELNYQVFDPNSRVCELISSPDLLLDQIAKCLSFMRTCVINNHLPNYVIPERNLIASRLTLESKQQLVDHLDLLLKEGRNIFCRLKIFIKHSSLSLVLAPSSVFFYGRKRDEIEKIFLLSICLVCKHIQSDHFFRATGLLEIIGKIFRDQRILALVLKLIDLVVPEWRTIISSGQFQAHLDMFNALLWQYLS